MQIAKEQSISPSDTRSDDEHPCDGCSNRHDCQDYHLACDVFMVFSETGRAREGPKNIDAGKYDAVYSGGEIRQKVNIISSDELYRRNCHHPRKRQQEWIERQIQELYTASTGSSFLDLILPEFREFEMWWAVTQYTGLVMGGVAIHQFRNADSVVYLYVRNSYKGMGIGSLLMDKVEAQSHYIILTPQEESIGFYEKRGYEKREGITIAPVYEKRFPETRDS